MPFYIFVAASGLRFLHESQETGKIYLTTSPHGATIYTDKARALRMVDMVNEATGSSANLMPTRVWEPGVGRGYTRKTPI